MSELTALKRMQKALLLQDVFVLRTEAHLEEGFDPKYSKDNLGVQIRFSPTDTVEHYELTNDSDADQKVRGLRYSVNTGIRFVAVGNDSRNEPLVRAEIIATFAADYLIKNPDLMDEEGVSAFSQNVVYHVWPYWREFVQSTCSRLRLPAAILPMFQPKRRGEQDKRGSDDQEKLTAECDAPPAR